MLSEHIFSDENIIDAVCKNMHPSIKDEYEKNIYIARFMTCVDDVYIYSDQDNLSPREILEMAFQIYGVRYRHPQSYENALELADSVGDSIEDIYLQKWALDVIKNNLT